MMGVSISYVTHMGKEVNITPGFRSTMASLLEDYRGRKIYASEIEDLKGIADRQRKGEEPSPFDWSQDIYDNIHKVIKAVESDGWAIITMEW